MTMTAARAFAFDMDGTIVDNMDYHTRSWVSFFAQRGKQVDPDEFFRATAGRHGREIIRHYLGEDLPEDEIAALNHEKELLYRELYGPHRKTIAGFEQLIAAAKAQGV